jgi:glycosyltransferase involved in cell wall biosynthesis
MNLRPDNAPGAATLESCGAPGGRIGSVLMVIESVFPAPNGGGAESQVRTLCAEYRRRGIAVAVLAPMVREGERIRTEHIDGVRVDRIPYPRVRWFGGLWMLVALLGWLVRERRSFDAIHAHIAGNMAAICCLAGRVLGKPVMVKLTGMFELRTGMLSPRPSPVQRLRSAAFRHATAYQAISQRIARSLVERGFDPQKVKYIPNAVDLSRFSDDRATDGDGACERGGRRLVGVFVGRLEAEKGLEYLFDGWAAALAGRDDVMLLVVGDGKELASLRRRCDRLGIAGQVRFVGPTERVEHYLHCADFGVLTSLHEGLSNTLLEYMACGLPVLGTRVSGTEDFVVDGRTGWLVEPGDADGVARALRAIASASPASLAHLGEQARSLVRERASVASIVDCTLALFEAGSRRAATQRT